MFVFIDLNRQWCRRIFWMFYVCVMAKRGKIHGRHQIKKKEKTQKEKRNCAVCVCGKANHALPGSQFPVLWDFWANIYFIPASMYLCTMYTVP